MAGIFLTLPHYQYYDRRDTAVRTEGSYRLALAAMLREIAGMLLAAMQQRQHELGQQKYEILDTLVENLETLVKVLHRQGAVRLRGDPAETIPELRLLDTELILYLEEAWRLAGRLLGPDIGDRTFRETAGTFMSLLAGLAEAAEQRNQLLGLGWESEFGLSPLPDLRKE